MVMRNPAIHNLEKKKSLNNNIQFKDMILNSQTIEYIHIQNIFQSKKLLSDFIIKVFNNVLNESTDFSVFTYTGSLFHKQGAAHRKERQKNKWHH